MDQRGRWPDLAFEQTPHLRTEPDFLLAQWCIYINQAAMVIHRALSNAPALCHKRIRKPGSLDHLIGERK